MMMRWFRYDHIVSIALIVMFSASGYALSIVNGFCDPIGGWIGVLLSQFLAIFNSNVCLITKYTSDTIINFIFWLIIVASFVVPINSCLKTLLVIPVFLYAYACFNEFSMLKISGIKYPGMELYYVYLLFLCSLIDICFFLSLLLRVRTFE